MPQGNALIVVERLDWPAFAAQHWDRRPVLFRSVEPQPFVESEVFQAAVRASRTRQPSAMPVNVQVTVERWQPTAPDGLLPRRADGSFDGYQERLRARLDGRRYALIVNALHAFGYPLWQRERSFLSGLWEQTGLPLTGAITTLFHGTYEHSPVGVHKDRFATFMFGVKGRKRMRFWPRRPWDEQVTTKTDYREHLAESFAVEIGPGDLLYWPADYYHVGESCGDQAATSVNVGVPREEHQARYEVEALLADLDPAMLVGAGPLPTFLPPIDAPLFAAACGADGVVPAAEPPALREAARQFRDYGAPRRIADRVTCLSLACWTAGGLAPVPVPARMRALPDEVLVRGVPQSPVRWADQGADGCACAVNGHTFRTEARAGQLRPVLERLCSGTPVAVRDLLAGLPAQPHAQPAFRPEDVLPFTREGVRRLLEHIESCRGITRLPARRTTTGD